MVFGLSQRVAMKQTLEKSVSVTKLCFTNASTVEGPEIKCGHLCLLQSHAGKKRKISVFVRVYRSCFEQYVVLYRDQNYSLQFGYVSLRNCTVTLSEDIKNQFKVILNDLEGSGLTFETDTHSEAREWMHTLQTTSSLPIQTMPLNMSPVTCKSRSPLMPTVEEDEEE